jgi:uroporphyrinogen-III decarboxylase
LGAFSCERFLYRRIIYDPPEDLAPEGGFVFTQVHNIQVGVPRENIMAMYNAVKSHGKYEI